jgi:hypothetical protein
MIEYLAKGIIIASILLVAVLASHRVWRADLDLRRLLSPQRAVESSVEGRLSWLPTRAPTALYQGDTVVARVEGAQVDEAHSRLAFDLIYQAASFDTTKEFEFQRWRVRFDSAVESHMWTSRYPGKGQTHRQASCTILGLRDVL